MHQWIITLILDKSAIFNNHNYNSFLFRAQKQLDSISLFYYMAIYNLVKKLRFIAMKIFKDLNIFQLIQKQMNYIIENLTDIG